MTFNVVENYTSAAERIAEMRQFYEGQDTNNAVNPSTPTTYFSLGSSATSTTYPGKTGTITKIPPNNTDNIEITYPNESPVSVARNTVTVVTVSGTDQKLPSWLTSQPEDSSGNTVTTYDYAPYAGVTYNTTIGSDDIPTPGSRFSDETVKYDGKITYGNYNWANNSSTIVGSDYISSGSTGSTGSGSTGNTSAGSTGYIGATTGNTSYELDSSILLKDNDILADYTSPTTQSYIAQDPMGYTADSATINKIYQILNSMITKNHCETSAFGCCKDRITAKSDMLGSNCSEAVVVGLNDDVKKYIDNKLSEQSFSFKPENSSLLQTTLPPPKENNLFTQKSYTNTIFLAPPRGNAASCPEPSFDSKITPSYSNVNSAQLPLPVLADFSSFGR